MQVEKKGFKQTIYIKKYLEHCSAMTFHNILEARKKGIFIIFRFDNWKESPGLQYVEHENISQDALA